MKINIQKEKSLYRYGRGCWYGITISVDNALPIMFRQDEFNEENTAYMSIFKINDKKFLEDNNIDYLIKDDTIIPIGIIDFQENDTRCNSSNLSLICNSKDKLYICESIIENIVEAIKIKYKSVEFDNTFDKDKSIEYQIEL